MKARNLIKIAVICVVTAGLGGCVSVFPHKSLMSSVGSDLVYRPVAISSANASKFYYARADIFEDAGATPEKRQAEMLKRSEFGPFDLPDTRRMLEGMAYYLFPRCGGAVARWPGAMAPGL